MEETMKTKISLTILLLLCVLSTSLFAVEWTGKKGIGIRGPVFIPMFKGDKFSSDNQPYMMGWDLTGDLKYGISENIAINLTVARVTTYDDTTATDNQALSLNNSDNAYSKLSGTLIGLTGNYYFRTDHKLQPYVLAGVGLDMWKLEQQEGDKTYNETLINAKLGLGANWWLTDNLALDVQGKMSFGQGTVETENPQEFYTSDDWNNWDSRPFTGYFEPSIGLSYYFGGGPDSDNDGVTDKKDRCPDTPFGAVVDKQGCPLDTDNDGVYDGLDKCLNTPEKAEVNADGCPIDTDGDGIFNGIDMCPETPENVEIDEYGCAIDTDEDGVPDYRDKELNTPKGALVDADGVGIDSDADGVYDGLDKCPGTMAGFEVNSLGCPFDADYDGVADSLDNCLGTPLNVKVDSLGCPVAKKLTEKITLHLNFASGSFDIDDASKVSVDSVVETMRAYPETRININGFTDSQGSRAHNLELSQKRAAAVRQYLMDNGIDGQRMIANGFGENPEYFVADNETAEGRWENRRVEIESANAEEE
jgi:outer membrane protein OmpA-like peptidoglycan-associated protein/opacity protein-like surface antigen